MPERDGARAHTYTGRAAREEVACDRALPEAERVARSGLRPGHAVSPGIRAVVRASVREEGCMSPLGRAWREGGGGARGGGTITSVKVHLLGAGGGAPSCFFCASFSGKGCSWRVLFSPGRRLHVPAPSPSCLYRALPFPPSRARSVSLGRPCVFVCTRVFHLSELWLVCIRASARERSRRPARASVRVLELLYGCGWWTSRLCAGEDMSAIRSSFLDGQAAACCEFSAVLVYSRERSIFCLLLVACFLMGKTEA